MNDTSKAQLEELRTRALASLRLLLGGLSVNGESHLLAMAKKAVSNAEQAEYRDAVQAYRLKWKAVEGRFVGNVEAAFLALQNATDPVASSPTRPTAPPVASSLDELAGLGVVDSSLMDQQIAVSNIAGRANLEHREAIMSLGVQVGRALGLRRPVTDRLPIAPQTLTSAFMDACAQVEVAPNVRITLARLFARFVLDELGPLYDQCVRVFPAESQAAPAPPVRPGAGQASEALRAIELPTANLGEEQVRVGVVAETSAELAWDSQRLPMLAAPGQALAMPRDLVDDLLHDIQEELLDPDALTAAMTSRMPAQPLDVLQLINDNLKAAGQARVMALPAEALEAISLMRALFEHVTRDGSVPMPVRRLTRLLQLPMLRAALREPDVLSNPEHASRVFLSAIGRAGAAWRPNGGVASEDLLRLIQVLVSRVLGDYDKDSSIFTAALYDLQRFEQMHAGKPPGDGSGPVAAAPAPRPTAMAVATPRPPASSEFVQLVDKLAPDTWVELRPPGQDRVRIQFVSRIPRTGMFSFLDAGGNRAGEWSRNDLAHMIENGEAVILRGQGTGGPPGRPGRR